MTKPPDLTWLSQDVLQAAPQLLGWELVSRAGGAETTGRIVEVEAYHGAQDPASHAYRGLSLRTAPMFEAAGTIYVYFTYGMHTCLNIVTGPAGEAQAVLIRALEPTRGQDTMAARRHTTDPRLLTSGPARLAQALGVTLSLSGSRLGETLSLHPPVIPAPPEASPPAPASASNKPPTAPGASTSKVIPTYPAKAKRPGQKH
jgi:DNA-3-methyladenine glycosylase